MPKNQRYTGTAVIERNSVPIRNELTSQSTRRKGICGNMVLVDYSAGQINKLDQKAPLERLGCCSQRYQFAQLCRNLPYHFRRLALPKEYWSRSGSGNSFEGIPVTLLRMQTLPRKML
jgi:hypothetical protein